MAKLKCHMPIMMNVAVYAMQFATELKLPQGLSFGVREGATRRSQGQEVDMVILLFYELVGGKVEVSYAYNGECSSICDAICDRTGVAPGIVLLGRGRGTLEGIREKLALVIWLFLRVRGGKVEVS